MQRISHRKLLRITAAFVIGFGLFAFRSLAQTTATEILGLAKDSSGAVVAGAKVTITRVATGQVLTKTTNQDGEYTFPLIEIGEYTVKIEMPGFRTQTVTQLKVE